MSADQIAEAQEEGWTPEDLARWYGAKYDLDYLGINVLAGRRELSWRKRCIRIGAFK
jgi:hypothetical protein